MCALFFAGAWRWSSRASSGSMLSNTKQDSQTSSSWHLGSDHQHLTQTSPVHYYGSSGRSLGNIAPLHSGRAVAALGNGTQASQGVAPMAAQ